jgi:hypothetical protein
MSELKFDKEDDDGQLRDLNQVEANLTSAIEKAGEDATSTSYSETSTDGGVSSRYVGNPAAQDEAVIVGSLNSKMSQGASVFLTVMADRNQSDSFPDQMNARSRSRFTDLVEPGYFEKRKRAVTGADEPRDKASVFSSRGGHHDFLLGSSKVSEKSLTEFGPKGVKLDAKTLITLGVVPKEYTNSLNNLLEAKNSPSSLRMQDAVLKGNDQRIEDYMRANPTAPAVQAALN